MRSVLLVALFLTACRADSPGRPPTVAERLQSDDPNERRGALGGLVRPEQAEPHAPRIRELTTDPDPWVRAYAAERLVLVPSPEAAEAVDRAMRTAPSAEPKMTRLDHYRLCTALYPIVPLSGFVHPSVPDACLLAHITTQVTEPEELAEWTARLREARDEGHPWDPERFAMFASAGREDPVSVAIIEAATASGALSDGEGE